MLGQRFCQELGVLACCALLGCLCALPLCALTCADEPLAVARLRGRSAGITKQASVVFGYGYACTRAKGQACPVWNACCGTGLFVSLCRSLTYFRGDVNPSHKGLSECEYCMCCSIRRCMLLAMEKGGSGVGHCARVRCAAPHFDHAAQFGIMEAPPGKASMLHCGTAVIRWYVSGAP